MWRAEGRYDVASMSKPLLAAGLLATMAGMWYWALLPTTRLGARPPMPTAIATRPSAAIPTVRLGSLAAEPVSVPAPPTGRNPFARGLLVVGNTDASRGPATDAAPSIAAPERGTTVWPSLDLIGVAEAREDGGIVRVAIVSGPQGVYHARAGELLEQVYRVERIAPDGVDIRLVPEDRTLRLALRP